MLKVALATYASSVKFCLLTMPALTLGLLAVSAYSSTAAEPPPTELDPSKQRYSLWSPVPASLMRPLSTDRPDTTESPYSVDAGHYQIEGDLVKFGYDRKKAGNARVTTHSLALAAVNLKAGLTNSVDVQLVATPYLRQRVEESGSKDSASGTGPFTIRTKFNLWGNDEGDNALALMPYLTLPMGDDRLSSGLTEGGLIVPFALALSDALSLGLMCELDLAEGGDQQGRVVEILDTATLATTLSDQLGAFVELASVTPANNRSDWLGLLDVGFTYQLNGNLQLDCGVNIGLNEKADDLTPFLGFSRRL